MNKLTTSLIVVLLLAMTSTINSKRMVGYWSLANGYANQPGCAPVLTPARIPAQLYTHIIFSFVFITTDFQVQEPTPEQLSYFSQIQELRQRNPNIILLVSLGGWSMDMSLYSNAVATPQSRATLVTSIMTFLRKYNWDGIDFDWEYPADPERGGKPEDEANFALFIKQMRAAVEAESVPSGKTKIELSIALPGGSWHGQNYNMPEMINDLDFANIMAYNLHGPWETEVYCSANFYDGTPSTSKYHGYSIHDAVQYFLHQDGYDLPGEKFNLGMTFAGVAFMLGDVTKITPGSPAIGEGTGGNCTREAGYMAYFEVETVLQNNNNIVTHFDEVGVCKYFEYNGQWIGYDDADTLAQKVSKVQDEGLGGISVWAMYAESHDGITLQQAIHDSLRNNENSSSTQSIFIVFILLLSVILL